jgi:hypothetical protein
MSPFIPAGYLTPAAAIDRVAAIMHGSKFVPPFTQEEENKLRFVEMLTRAPLPEIKPVHMVGMNRPFVTNKPADRVARRCVEDDPPPSKPTPEEYKDLKTREVRKREQQQAAGETLRQLLYAGRVPSKTITEEGLRIETPKHVWGGNQWYEVIRSSRIKFADGLGVSISGRPMIPQDALEAAFTPGGTVKEEPEPVAPRPAAARMAEQPRRGRKPTWDWDGPVGHLLSVANTPDGLPDHQADIELLVAKWFRDTFDAEPVESAIRKHVSAWCKGVLGKA